MLFLILTFVFFFCSLALFCALFYFFFLYKECKILENKLKQAYNQLLEYDFDKINLPIEHIALMYLEKNTEFENVVELFNLFAEQFHTKTTTIQKTLSLIPIILQNYDWKSFWKLKRELEAELNQIQRGLQRLFVIKTELLAFKEYYSQIMVDYREKSWELINFWAQNCKLSGDNEQEINHWSEQLSHANLLLNENFHKYNIPLLASTLEQLNNAFVILWTKVHSIYLLEKQNNYINFAIAETKKFVSTNQTLISNQKLNESAKVLSWIEKQLEYLHNKTIKTTAKQTNQMINNIINRLIALQKDLKITYVTNHFFYNHQAQLNNIFVGLKDSLPSFLTLLQTLQKHFALSQVIKKAIHNLETQTSGVYEQITAYFTKNKKQSGTKSNEQVITNTMQIIKAMVEIIQNSNELVQTCENKYHYWHNITTTIINHQILLTQMEPMLQTQIKPQPKIQLSQIHKWKNELTNLNKNLVKNPDHNEIYWLVKLNEITTDIQAAFLMLIDQVKLQAYNDQLLAIYWYEYRLQQKKKHPKKAVLYQQMHNHKKSIQWLVKHW